MHDSIRHADLVARALGVLDDVDRDRVDRAMTGSRELREQFEAVAAHLLAYDAYPEAPDAPPFERLGAALDGLSAAAPRRVARADLPRKAPSVHPRWRIATLAATVLVAASVAVLTLTSNTASTPARAAPIAVRLGAGIEILREGAPVRRVPSGATLALGLETGAVLETDAPAELVLAERVRIVLDAGSPLRLRSANAVHLGAGRAFFEVEPGGFQVHTPYGDVLVVGTRFEVDLRYGRLGVQVEAGLVQVSGTQLEAGARLGLNGQPEPALENAAAWFREPRLELTRDGARSRAVPPGAPLKLRLEIVNPHHVPLNAPGPAADRTALYLVVQRLVRTAGGTEGTWQPWEQPWALTDENILSGESVVRPGQRVILGGGERRGLALQFRSLFSDPGTYRLRIGYHPEGRPPITSAPLEIEVIR